MGEIERIAASLTKAQRAALRAMSATRFKSARTIIRHAKLRSWPGRHRGGSLIGLLERDDDRWKRDAWIKLSPLGRQVAAKLQEASQP